MPSPFVGPPGDAQLSVSVLLNTTLYNAYPGTDVEDTLEKMRAGDADGSIPEKVPIKSYHYIRSYLKLLKLYPELTTCYQDVIFGAPSIKIRLSALTATDYNTIRSAGVYTREVDQEPASETSNSVPSSPTPAPASVPKSPAETTIAVVYPSQPLQPSNSEKSLSYLQPKKFLQRLLGPPFPTRSILKPVSGFQIQVSQQLQMHLKHLRVPKGRNQSHNLLL